ncbi:NAD(P)H-dependent oxidoreductase [Microbacterium sp. LWS13-1.2]|uniref:NAD(P)H-dependent oxidoreductase n=1 Tax=Microbacterium sp. LWS13-1.2 TaxID=3135264 RepID=A0AAU6SBT7_9MICO
MSLFRLDASIFPTTSASRALADLVEAEWAASHPDSTVTRRDLATDPVPATAWADAVAGGFIADAQLTSAQIEARVLATAVADELIGADALLFAVPLYNYGISQHFKSWFDLAYTDSRIGPSGTTLLGKPATLVTVLGGNYAPGTPKDGWDHSTGWLRRVLEDVWGLDLRVVLRPFTLVGVNPALDDFADTARELKQAAETAARAYGQELAALRHGQVA